TAPTPVTLAARHPAPYHHPASLNPATPPFSDPPAPPQTCPLPLHDPLPTCQYSNIGTVTANDANNPPGTQVTASNPDHYFGDAPSIQLATLPHSLTNDTCTLLHVTVGSTVTWTYNVTATGSNVPLTNVSVPD